MDLSIEQHHHQEMGSQTLESMLVCTKAHQEKKPRPAEQSLNCPRCDSTNTKFCYYNNYSLSQPRYFCKSCRRYWTKGGTLRNVPVGGGCRKNKRSSSSSSSTSSSSSSKRNPSQSLITPNHNPSLALPFSSSSSPSPSSYDASDLTLAFAGLHKGQLGFGDHDLPSLLCNPSNAGHCDVLGSTGVGFLDALRGGFMETPNGFHQGNLYYGNLGHLVENEGLGLNVGDEMTLMPSADEMGFATTTATSVTAVKQEVCNGRDGEVSKVLWGHPWQMNGGDGNVGHDHLDSGRQSWNGFSGSSSWHGLLNSPLM